MKNIEQITDLLKALSDPTRLKILLMLRDTDCMLCVNAISRQLGISQSAVSQHLKVLRHCKLVKGERKGYHVHYTVDASKVEYLCKQLLDGIA